MKRSACALAALALVGTTPASAQNIEWKQPTVVTPKGLNLPKGLKLDVLGIELGETIDEVKPKLEALLAEVRKAAPPPAPAPNINSQAALDMAVMRMRDGLQSGAASEAGGASGGPAIVETPTRISIGVPGGNVTAEFISGLALTRTTPGTGGSTINDHIQVNFSAPSSGRQVLVVARTLGYNNQADQPRVSELMGRIKARLGTEPQVFDSDNSVTYRFQFDDGRLAIPANARTYTCRPLYPISTPAGLKEINPTRDCDVVFNIEISYGISKDHAKRIEFRLGDNERIKANITADFAYMQQYVQDMQSRARGTQPRL